MKRHGWRTVLQLVGVLAALFGLGLSSRPLPAAAKSFYSYEFEQGLESWAAGSGSQLAVSHSDSFCPVDDGHGMALLGVPLTRSALALPAGHNATTAAYMGATFPVRTNDSVLVNWATKPGLGCEKDGACQPVIYTGTATDLTSIKWTVVKGKPGAEGWSHYQYQVNLQGHPEVKDKVYIALGIARFGPSGFMSVGVDCVTVQIQPSAN